MQKFNLQNNAINPEISWLRNDSLLLAQNFSMNSEFHMWHYDTAMVTFRAKIAQEKKHNFKQQGGFSRAIYRKI